MKHFFSVYKALEGKETVVNDIQGREDALKIIENCINAYNTKFGK
ncbi:MAG: inorganic diphosphatase [Acutalibacteraceae bacterium]